MVFVAAGMQQVVVGAGVMYGELWHGNAAAVGTFTVYSEMLQRLRSSWCQSAVGAAAYEL